MYSVMFNVQINFINLKFKENEKTKINFSTIRTYGDFDPCRV